MFRIRSCLASFPFLSFNEKTLTTVIVLIICVFLAAHKVKNPSYKIAFFFFS